MAVIKVMKHSNGPIMADTSEKKQYPPETRARQDKAGKRRRDAPILTPHSSVYGRETRKNTGPQDVERDTCGPPASLNKRQWNVLQPSLLFWREPRLFRLKVQWNLRMFRVLPTFADPCRDPLGPERCKEGVENRYYYDVDAGHCKETGFGFCSGHWDSFIGLEECKTRCESEPVFPIVILR
ncbi:hypothetical protein HPB51_018358 [Rhipicephalus microplus]|uniref:BPTI/Kunitz inhibitor domain-containing protein n=1 Tax=Rhipicephalus microplus TaxID=6941 RepID=A0A9J6EU56_RHIMP|nr:hypothetical protein HPB51_018358 [Rhipicephalus microplus]